jgi:hypothetical protein
VQGFITLKGLTGVDFSHNNDPAMFQVGVNIINKLGAIDRHDILEPFGVEFIEQKLQNLILEKKKGVKELGLLTKRFREDSNQANSSSVSASGSIPSS